MTHAIAGPHFSDTFHHSFWPSFRQGGDPKVFNELREAYEALTKHHGQVGKPLNDKMQDGL